MNHPIPAGDYVEHFDPELPHHRVWLLAVLEQLVAHEPRALEEGGTLRRLWTAHQTAAGAGTAPEKDIPAAVVVALPLVREFEGCRHCRSVSYILLITILRSFCAQRTQRHVLQYQIQH
jgi:hypothetical protein